MVVLPAASGLTCNTSSAEFEYPKNLGRSVGDYVLSECLEKMSIGEYKGGQWREDSGEELGNGEDQ